MPYRTSIIWVSVFFFHCSAVSQVTLSKQLGAVHASLKLRFNQYDEQRYSRLIRSETADIPAFENQPVEIVANGVTWQVSYATNETRQYNDVLEVKMNFRVMKGSTHEASVSLDFTFDNWNTENFVLAPAALYNGNRFESRTISYSPKLNYYAPGFKNPSDASLDIPEDIGKNVPTIISDVPRLAIGKGLSRVQFRSGDMSTPAMGFYSPFLKQVCWILTEQGNELGDYGFDIEETKDRKNAIVSITAPVVREQYQYKITTTREPSPDRGPDFAEGDSFSMRFFVFTGEAGDLQELYSSFIGLRKIPFDDASDKHELPFSAAASLMVDELNSKEWNEDKDYFSIGSWKRWTAGWTGGFQLLYGLYLSEPDSISRYRLLRNLQFAFTKALSPSGFFWDAMEGEFRVSGDFRRPHTRNWHLVRRSADGLYYSLQLLQQLDAKEISWAKKAGIVAGYQDSLRKLADVFVRIWKKEGQLGQFVNNFTGEIIVGGSASGSLVPAALVLAASYYKEPGYLVTAREIMMYFDSAFIRKGYTTGGPADALQNPDSESAYSMIESALALYQATGEKQWLDMAERMTVQFASWVSSYNYKFPASSTFGKIGIQSKGAVWANTQNKHGSPNICTHGGLGLLKLYLITGNPFYAELLRDIVHGSVQYISRKDKPIGDVPFGGVDERCSTTDWLEGIGEVFNQTTWAEIANLLSVTQLPGMVVKQDGSFSVFDHYDIRQKKKTRNGFEYEIFNPTTFNGVLKIFVQGSGMDLDKPANFLKLAVNAGERKLINIPVDRKKQ